MAKVWLKRIIITLVILTLLGGTAVGAFLAGVATGVLTTTQSTGLSEEVIAGDEEEAKIGILNLEGIILTSGSQEPFSTDLIVTSREVKRWFREIVKDESLKAVVLEVNSPGGSPVAADEIYQAIQKLREAGLSVVVVMGDTATSGAYFFSVAADRIIANPATLTGSIGVITELTNAQELLAKLGIAIEVYKSGEFKDFTSFSRGRTEEEKAIIQEFIDTAYDLFVSRVATGRNMPEESVRALAQGQVYSGEKALQLGLVDKLGSLEDGVTEAKTLAGLTQAKIVRYRTESPLDILLGRVGATLNPLGTLLLRLTSPGFKAAYLPPW